MWPSFHLVPMTPLLLGSMWRQSQLPILWLSTLLQDLHVWVCVCRWICLFVCAHVCVCTCCLNTWGVSHADTITCIKILATTISSFQDLATWCREGGVGHQNGVMGQSPCYSHTKKKQGPREGIILTTTQKLQPRDCLGFSQWQLFLSRPITVH